MPRFFVENFSSAEPIITGDDALHIRKSLRMKAGESVTVCDTAGNDYFCRISALDDNTVQLEIEDVRKSESEPDIELTLFQCMPKGDKLESVVQKSVELGVTRIIPVLSSRCVSRPDEKSARKKTERYQKIADNAAGQSGRGILPAVSPMIRFDEMTAMFGEFDRVLFFYECGGKPMREIIKPGDKKIAVIVGPEGGFDISEAEKAEAAGAQIATLGKRILRTETAPVAAIGCIMLLTGNME